MIDIRITSSDTKRIRRSALLLSGLVIVLWLAYVVREIWLPLIIALVIAMVLDPLVDRMERRGWSRTRSAALIFAAFFVVAGATLSLAIPSVVNQTSELTKTFGQYLPSTGNETQTKRSLQKLMQRFHATPFVESTVTHASSQISQGLNRSSSWLGDAAKNLVANLIWLVIIPIVAFYALQDYHIIYARLLLFVPTEHRGTAQNLINDVTNIFVSYLRGMLIICAMNAVATAALLAVFHVPNAMGLGAIAGSLYLVPYLGPVITYVLAIGACLTAGMTMKTVGIILLLLVFLHSLIFDQILTPRILGKQVGIHPILSIIALLVGGIWLGIVGVILAVPFAAVLQMVLGVIFPKLTQPIDVPAGLQLHDRVDEEERVAHPVEEIGNAIDVHQTIVNAVDSAEGAQRKSDPAIGVDEMGTGRRAAN